MQQQCSCFQRHASRYSPLSHTHAFFFDHFMCMCIPHILNFRSSAYKISMEFSVIPCPVDLKNHWYNIDLCKGDFTCKCAGINMYQMNVLSYLYRVRRVALCTTIIQIRKRHQECTSCLHKNHIFMKAIWFTSFCA